MRRHGFTLIELLVVVAIIALLIAILLPSLKKARDTAQMVACQSNLRQMQIANVFYAQAARNWYVMIRDPAQANKMRWYQNRLYMSALNMQTADDPDGIDNQAVDFGNLNCPTMNDRRQTFNGRGITYGMNREQAALPSSYNPGISVGDSNYDALNALYQTSIKRPAQVLSITDGNDWHLARSYANYVIRWDVYGPTGGQSTAYRHDEGANLVYFDGHTAYFTKYEVYAYEAEVRNRLWLPYK